MKRAPFTLLSLLLALGMLWGCGGNPAPGSTAESASPPDESAAESTPSQQPAAPSEAQDTGEEADAAKPGDTTSTDGYVTYRGEVVALLEDGGIEVAQLYGFNYGYERVIFYPAEDAEVQDNGFVLGEGAFVEVSFNGIVTRSDPPQCTTDAINIVASFSDGIIINGRLDEVAESGTGYTLTVHRYQTPMALATAPAPGVEALPDVEDGDADTVIVQVESNAFEHMTADDLAVGAEVSIVANGIMALSMPPQAGAHVVLPFRP